MPSEKLPARWSAARVEADFVEHLVDSDRTEIRSCAAVARRWFLAVRPGCMLRASSTEPTTACGAQESV